MNKNFLLLIILSLFICLTQYGGDNAHFYRATNFYGEPRLSRPKLFSLDVTIGHGSTNESRADDCRKKTCLLNIYGPSNMLALGDGVPCKDPLNFADLALINVGRLPAHGNFGKFIFQGEFSITEANFWVYQNLDCGVFLELHVPWRHLEISNIQSRDLSAFDFKATTSNCTLLEVNECTDVNNPIWQAFLNSFDAILARYCLSLSPIDKKGIGDTSVLLGYAYSYIDHECLDFIDTSFKLGILVPTACQKSEDLVFDIPLGYNGHLGFIAQFDGSMGVYDWLTIGLHLGAIPFREKIQDIRLKTSSLQSGFIKLAKGAACIRPGTIWEAGSFVKADHICKGFSFICAYAYARQSPDTVIPRSEAIDAVIACSDLAHAGWTMHTLNFLAEYDFAKRNCKIGPRIGVFYNLIVGGKHIFNTNVGGGGLGVDVALDF